MEDQGSLQVVRDYFKSAFPGCRVEDKYDVSFAGRSFQVTCGSSTYFAVITDGFFSKHPVKEISRKLSDILLIDHLRDLPSTIVFVTEKGLSLEYE